MKERKKMGVSSKGTKISYSPRTLNFSQNLSWTLMDSFVNKLIPAIASGDFPCLILWKSDLNCGH